MTNEERANKFVEDFAKEYDPFDYMSGAAHEGTVIRLVELLTQVRNEAIEEVMEEKMFPMQDGPNIPWSLAETIYAGYSALYGTDQSLDRIAERHGFGWAEVAYLYKRERFRKTIEALKDGDK